MKVLLCEEPGRFKYVKRDEPLLQNGNAILKVKCIGICGTDLHAFEGTQPYFEYPRVLGHELACEIADIKANNDFKIGDRVTFIPYFNCGECESFWSTYRWWNV
jgi:threonine dehydrogenase-like Zn-dependent dehydrogenase